MSENDRLLIATVTRHGDRADLTARGHQYRDLILFDLASLLDVGINPTTLPEGQPFPCRFWAEYTIGTKLNKNGNPYRDVVALHPYEPPATAKAAVEAANGHNDPLLQELIRIRELLQSLSQRLTPLITAAELPADPPNDTPVAESPTLAYGNGSPVSDNEAEIAAFVAYAEANRCAPRDVGTLRAWCRASLKR